MADPFTIALGVVSLLGTARKVLDGLAVLQNAPREIEELRCATDELRNLVAAMTPSDSDVTFPWLQDNRQIVQPSLEAISKLAVELSDYVGDISFSLQTSSLKKGLNALIWAKKRNAVRRLTERVIKVKLGLSIALQQQHIDYTLQGFRVVENLIERYCEPTITEIEDDVRNEASATIKKTTTSKCLDQTRESMSYLTYSRLEAQNCDCTCHHIKQWSSPACLGGLLGRFIVAQRSPAPCLRSSCLTTCTPTTNTMSMAYVAPSGLLDQRMVILTIVSSPQLTPSLQLAFPRVVAGFAMIFHYASAGDVEAIKQLFVQGLASPDDIRYDCGFTALHYAVQSNSLEAVRFLIQAGANPALPSIASKTSMDLAFAKVTSGAEDSATVNQLTALFKVHDAFQDKHFTLLHNAILGRIKMSLEDALQADFSSLNTTDVHGRTPLSWAAERGDADAVALLLDLCADLHQADMSGMTPLHYAATSRSLRCLDLLLAAGAATDVQDKDRGWTPLHYVAYLQSDETWIEHMLEYKVDVNVRTNNGNLPLVLAIIKSFAETARCLISAGAKTNVRTNDGYTPLNLAIVNNSAACVDILLEAGVDLGETWQDEVILHLVARHADERLMRVLLMADLFAFDLGGRNANDQTADVIFEQRRASPAVRRAFADLRLKIQQDSRMQKRRQLPSSASDIVDDDAPFYDAVETLGPPMSC